MAKMAKITVDVTPTERMAIGLRPEVEIGDSSTAASAERQEVRGRRYINELVMSALRGNRYVDSKTSARDELRGNLRYFDSKMMHHLSNANMSQHAVYFVSRFFVCFSLFPDKLLINADSTRSFPDNFVFVTCREASYLYPQ